MGKDKLEVISAQQTERIERIQSYHERCIGAFKTQMGYAFLCGAELNAAKAQIPHGEFTEWRERYLPNLPARSATQYMKFTDALAKTATVADLKNPLRLCDSALKTGSLPDDEREKILKAVHEAADGKTLTQLYRDLGVIRDPKDPNATEKKRTKLSAEEEVAAERETAIGIAHQVIQAMRAARGLGQDEGATLTLLPKSEQDALKAEHALFGKALKKYCKRGKGKGAKK